MFASLLKFIMFFFSLCYQEKILIIGDSEAAHVSHFFNYVRQEHETINAEFKGGTTIQDWFGSRSDDALNKNPDTTLIIIFLGTNNIGRKTELDISPLTNKFNGKRCIWVGPPSVNGIKWKFNKLLETSVLKNSNCKYFNSENIALHLPDGYHPDGQSNILWLKKIWEFKNHNL